MQAFHAGCCPTFQCSSCLVQAFPKPLASPETSRSRAQTASEKETAGKRISQVKSCVSKHDTGLLQLFNDM